MNDLIMIQVILIFLIFLIYYFSIFFCSDVSATYVRSKFDGRNYLVQDMEDKSEASYILSIIRQRIKLFKDYLILNKEKYPEFRKYIDRLVDRLRELNLQESTLDSNYTSYTINKRMIFLCLRSKKNKKLHDINLIMYVVLHELAHIACPDLDHTDLFKKIFVFFLRIAVKLGIYKKIDYRANPHEYCGLIIRENLIK